MVGFLQVPRARPQKKPNTLEMYAVETIGSLESSISPNKERKV